MTENADLEQVVTQFRRQLRDFLRRRVSSEAVADDLLQEVWLKVSKSLSELPSVREMDSWLYRIARNVLIDFYRRHRTSTDLPEDLPAEPDDSSVTQLREQLNDYIRDVVESLGEPYREALKATVYEEISQVELAERLGLSVSAAKSRVQRARAEVRKKMEACCAWEFDAYGNATECEPKKKDACKQC
jgi:RNA polymerase sigma-70 factor (ECF subfamily)